MTATLELAVIMTIAASSTSVAHRNTFSEPSFCPSLAPSIVNPATAIEFATMAVPIMVGAVLNSATMPPMETGNALMFSDICA